MNKEGKKLPPVIDNLTGKQYFNFNVGAEYEVDNYKTNQHYVYKILDCAYLSETEYYTVARDGRQLFEPVSANRLRFLLTYNVTATQIAAGERRELPLTVDEVKQFYFDHYQTVWNREHKAALARLENTDYSKIQSRINFLAGKAEYMKEENRIVKQYFEILEEKLKLEGIKVDILLKANVNEYYLRDEPDYICKSCKDTGIDNGAICSCALHQFERIKDYNGKKRLGLNRG